MKFHDIKIITINLNKKHNKISGRVNADSKGIYEEVNGQIEKWGKIIYFVIAELSPICMIVPKAILCLLVYFTTDLGQEAFELPVLEW